MNLLKQVMKIISQEENPSIVYTNDSIRATSDIGSDWFGSSWYNGCH